MFEVDDMATTARSLQGCLEDATAKQTRLANAILHLYKDGFVPTPATTLAEFVAQEADFASYVPITIATYNGPILAPGTGYQIDGGLQTFLWVSAGLDVQNLIAGAFLELAGATLDSYITFTAVIPMQGPGQGLQVIPIEIFPTGT